MKYKFILLFSLLAVFFQTGFASAAYIGKSEAFFVDPDFVFNEKTRVKATLKFEGKNAYYYVEDTFFNSRGGVGQEKILNSLAKISEEYDKKIYPVLTEKLGSLGEPGVDGDDKIYILFLELKEGNGGYVNTADVFLKDRTNGKATNEKEIVYLNVNFINKNDINPLLAHELQHLISVHNKEIKKSVVEDVWLNELRSEYALELLGYDEPYEKSFLKSRVRIFNENLTDSLTEWQNNPADYAVVNLFSHYLAGKYGEIFFKKILQSDKVGIASINAVLHELGYSTTFLETFRNWQIANYLNKKVEYKYLDNNILLNIKPTVTQEVFSGDEKELSYIVKDWQQAWLKYYGDAKTLNITFKGATGATFDLSYILNKKDGGVLVKRVDLINNEGFIGVGNLGEDIKSVVLLPIAKTKISNFSKDDPERKFTVSISTTGKLFENKRAFKISRQFLPVGSLIRPAWDFSVYVVNGDKIRHIKNQNILSLYDASSVRVLKREEFNIYKESFLIRAKEDFKVYEIDASGARHWLDVTAEEFLKSGKSFDDVFQISKNELQLYAEGVSITR